MHSFSKLLLWVVFCKQLCWTTVGADPEAWSLAKEFQQASSYHSFIRLMVQAISASYTVPPGCYHKPAKHNFTMQGWERVRSLERLSGIGLAAVVFQDSNSRRMIISYRGSCLDVTWMAARMDICAAMSLVGSASIFASVMEGAWSNLTTSTYTQMALAGLNELARWWCPMFDKKDLNYLDRALEIAMAAQKEFPDHALLLTGHSLGGLLAQLTAAKLNIEALAIAPPELAATQESHLSALSLQHRSNKLWAIYSPEDFLYRSSHGTVGINKCVYTPSAHGGHTFRMYVKRVYEIDVTNCTDSMQTPKGTREEL